MKAPACLAGSRRRTTREHIIAVAKHLLVAAPTEPFTHERVAQSAGLGARTVYRHFPSRTDLMQALWESIRDETRTRFPGTEEEVVEFARTQFKDFNEREALVRASNAFPGASELRARERSREGRHSAAASQRSRRICRSGSSAGFLLCAWRSTARRFGCCCVTVASCRGRNRGKLRLGRYQCC